VPVKEEIIMCFSAPASFTAATLLSVIGFACIQKTNNHRLLPYAITPFIFALQQALEGIVWLTLTQPNSVWHLFSLYGFNFFSAMFWPLWVPISLAYAEPYQLRKRILIGLSIVGSIVTLISLVSMLFCGITAQAIDHHIVYRLAACSITHSIASFYSVYAGWTLYLIATVGAMFISSIRGMWCIGLLVVTAFVAAQIAYHTAFGSVWCFFAAIISCSIYYLLPRDTNIR
jgi:hypothetical protein